MGKGIVRSLLNSADEIIRGSADDLALNYAKTGARPKVRANTAASDTTTLMGRAVNKARTSKVGEAMLSTRSRSVVKSLDDGTIEQLKDMSVQARQKALKSTTPKDIQAQTAIAERAERIVSGGGNDAFAGKFKTNQRWGDAAANYYGDAQYGTTRKLVTGGAVAGGMVGGRFLTGGDLTHNGNGERDIVGIPFI